MREPGPEDVKFIFECYRDWPVDPRRGIVTLEKVDRWVRRWTHRDDEHCLINENGLVTFRYNMYAAVIDNLIVHPYVRGRGHSKEIIQYVTDHLFEKGVLVATFDTLPGVVREKYPDGVVTAL